MMQRRTVVLVAALLCLLAGGLRIVWRPESRSSLPSPDNTTPPVESEAVLQEQPSGWFLEGSCSVQGWSAAVEGATVSVRISNGKVFSAVTDLGGGFRVGPFKLDSSGQASVSSPIWGDLQKNFESLEEVRELTFLPKCEVRVSIAGGSHSIRGVYLVREGSDPPVVEWTQVLGQSQDYVFSKLPPGRYIAKATGLASEAEAEFELRKNGAQLETQLNLVPVTTLRTHEICGTIRVEGELAENLLFEWVCAFPDGMTQTASVISNADGEFCVKQSLPLPGCKAYVRADGYVRAELDLLGVDRVQIDLYLPREGPWVFLRTSNGDPIPSATVLLPCEIGQNQKIRADEDGVFSLVGTDFDDEQIFVNILNMNGFAVRETTRTAPLDLDSGIAVVNAGGATATIELPEGYHPSGQVTLVFAYKGPSEHTHLSVVRVRGDSFPRFVTGLPRSGTLEVFARGLDTGEQLLGFDSLDLERDKNHVISLFLNRGQEVDLTVVHSNGTVPHTLSVGYGGYFSKTASGAAFVEPEGSALDALQVLSWAFLKVGDRELGEYSVRRYPEIELEAELFSERGTISYRSAIERGSGQVILSKEGCVSGRVVDPSRYHGLVSVYSADRRRFFVEVADDGLFCLPWKAHERPQFAVITSKSGEVVRIDDIQLGVPIRVD